MKFAYHKPGGVPETLSLIEECGGNAAFLAGGTDLLVEVKRGVRRPAHVIDLKGLRECNCLRRGENGELRIGALTTLQALSSSPLLQGGWNLLAQASSKIGSWQIRNRATLGGNICHASPSGDTLPGLLCLGAQLTLVSRRGTRNLDIQNFFLGPGQSALQAGELLVEVVLPPLPPQAKGVYKKFSLRRAMDLAVVGVAVLAWRDPANKTFEDVRIGLGAVGPAPIRAFDAEQALKKSPIREDVLAQAAGIAAAAAAPISDVRATEGYRREMVRHLVQEALREVLG